MKNTDFRTLLAEERASHIANLVEEKYGLPTALQAETNERQAWGIYLYDLEPRNPVVFTDDELLHEDFNVYVLATKTVSKMWDMLTLVPLNIA